MPLPPGRRRSSELPSVLSSPCSFVFLQSCSVSLARGGSWLIPRGGGDPSCVYGRRRPLVQWLHALRRVEGDPSFPRVGHVDADHEIVLRTVRVSDLDRHRPPTRPHHHALGSLELDLFPTAEGGGFLGPHSG